MGSLLLILALLFSLLIAIIALANNQPVTVNYLFGRAETSLIVLILGSAIGGALAMGLFSLFRGIRTVFRFREERRKHEGLRQRVEALEREKNRLEAELGRAREDVQESQRQRSAGGDGVAEERPGEGSRAEAEGHEPDR